VFEIATVFEKGLTMTEKLSLYPLNGYRISSPEFSPGTIVGMNSGEMSISQHKNGASG